MKRSKLAMIALSSLVSLALILSACGKATPTPEPTPVPPTAVPTRAPTPTEAPPEEVTIRLAFWELGGLITPRMQFNVDIFNETFPNINVEFVVSPEAFAHRDTLLTMMGPPWSGRE